MWNRNGRVLRACNSIRAFYAAGRKARGLSSCIALTFLLCGGLLAQGTRPAAEPEGPNHDNPLARELWFRHGRMVPGKPGAAARLLRRAYQQKLQLRATRVGARPAAAISAYSSSPATASTSTTSTSYGGWVPLGPAPINSNATGTLGEQDYGAVVGRATSVVADPGDPTGNTVYLGGAYGGLWKSTNAAASNPSAVTWTPLIDQQATLAVGSVAVQPSSSGPSSVVLVGTGEADFSIDSYYGLGILRSTDAGNTWTLISSPTNAASFSGLAFAKIAFSTDNPNLVVAAATGAGNDEGASGSGGGSTPGLYTSSDGGQTWALALGGSFSGIGSTSVIYDSASHKFFAFLQFDGYYGSSDGMNWRRLPSQPGSALQSCQIGANGAPFCLVFRGEMAVVPGREELYTWYVAIDRQGNINDGGIYKSTNGGSSWQQVSDSGITNCGDGRGNGCGVEQGWFNLVLAAVPNGAGTDLYAGTINIYKCSINASNPLCGARPFINLTHVYGCSPLGSLSHVHPDQHGMSFVRVSPSQVVMYFANDGGIYRALNGYALNSGSCGTPPNPFQNLNGTMGSMAEFVDFSNDPTDASTLLGGTQDNGSPATDAQYGSNWISVNGGDGGFNAIDPTTGMWFTSNTDVSVQSCPNSINCLAQTFDPVVTNSTVGGDHGFFYTPFILDPQASSRMMVGTCRLWRGNNSGGGFAPLSYNFDSVLNQTLDGPCSGGETQLIRSIAAGGPNTGNGSSVIYVGTDGGLAGNGLVTPGEIWVTNNADLGPFTWSSFPATLNPAAYAISSIAVDATDPTGNTAYAAIMGFGTNHILQTMDQGLTWTAMGMWAQPGAQLPNSPVNVILIDPDDSHTFYVATDVGVYTSHDLQNWTELGQLPNVAVTQLHIFEASGVKQLRAGTYGRGIWSYDIPYQIKITTPHVYLLPGQSGAIQGVVTGYNGYTSPVTVTCSAANFGTCSSTTVTPTPSGAPFSLTIAASTTALSDYNLNVQGTGTDPNATAEATPATVTVADYSFSLESNSLTVSQGATSGGIYIYPSRFYEPVTLSCSSLPPGESCNFSPSAVIPAVNPNDVILTISATSNAAVGTYSVTVNATASGQPSPKTASFSLSVTNNPDYSMVIAPPPSSILPGGAGAAQIILTPVGGYTGPVTLSCNIPSGLTTCSLSPAGPIVLAGSSVAVSVRLTASPDTSVSSAGANTAIVNATGPNTATHFAGINFTVMDFAVAARSNGPGVIAGHTADYELFVTPVGPPFTNPISFSCSGLPAGSTCSFWPATVTPNNAPAIVVLSIGTAAKNSAVLRPSAPALQAQLMLALLLPGMVIAASGGRRGRKPLFALLLLLVLAALLLQPACGGGGSSTAPAPPPPAPPPPSAPPPPATYNVTVTATSGTVQHQIPLSLVVYQQ